MGFRLRANYKAAGSQPQAIRQMVEAVEAGHRYNTLLGVTGSGKTFTMANVVAQLDRPTLVLCHNKTLAAQLFSEFKNFFPENAIEYYVSYYDYYQPEAYLPTTGTYIEKDLSINEEIEKMRLSTTTTLLSGRRDVLVVSSVSCIYGIGNPEDFKATSIELALGDKLPIKHFMYRLVEALYTRTEREMQAATFRINGDSIDVMSAFGEQCYRITFFGDSVEQINSIDCTSGQRMDSFERITISPANLFVTTKERIATAIGEIYVDMGEQVRAFEASERMIEAQRLKQRVEYDLEMIKELGYCSGIENYSRYFDRRKPGEAPFCLLNYFPDDYLTIIDESHVTVPQIRGMAGGDKARKENLVSYGFRLEAARDNRPLNYDEFDRLTNQAIYVSATPGDKEIKDCGGEVIEQIIRPTGLLDPRMIVRPADGQIDDLLSEISQTTRRGDKVIVTTITKRMAEEVSKYLGRIGIRNRYIHSDIDTLERVQIINELHEDAYDVLVGVNLLREGIDLPSVALVAILDADKEGLLRNYRALIQVAGRAARHLRGRAILYANRITDSMAAAIRTASRQRLLQIRHNTELKQLPETAKRSGEIDQSLLSSDHSQTPVRERTVQYSPLGDAPERIDRPVREVASPKSSYSAKPNAPTSSKASAAAKDYDSLIAAEKAAMEAAAKALDFAAAIKHRDAMQALAKERANMPTYKK